VVRLLCRYLNLCCKYGKILNIVLDFHFSVGAAAPTTHNIASPLDIVDPVDEVKATSISKFSKGTLHSAPYKLVTSYFYYPGLLFFYNCNFLVTH
jgi:hypothetical protein